MLNVPMRMVCFSAAVAMPLMDVPFAGGVEWGTAGVYERLKGTAFMEVNPLDPLNAMIIDLDKAPRNSRGMVEFSRFNLLDAWPAFPPIDICYVRNVLIYFDVESKKQILAKVRRILRLDGHLFLGGAETTLHLDDAFERVQFDLAGCYRLVNKGS